MKESANTILHQALELSASERSEIVEKLLSSLQEEDSALNAVWTLEMNESVTVLYQGKVKGVIRPVSDPAAFGVNQHPFFGMYKQPTTSVQDELERLRKPRHDV